MTRVTERRRRWATCAVRAGSSSVNSDVAAPTTLGRSHSRSNDRLSTRYVTKSALLRTTGTCKNTYSKTQYSTGVCYITGRLHGLSGCCCISYVRRFAVLVPFSLIFSCDLAIRLLRQPGTNQSSSLSSHFTCDSDSLSPASSPV